MPRFNLFISADCLSQPPRKIPLLSPIENRINHTSPQVILHSLFLENVGNFVWVDVRTDYCVLRTCNVGDTFPGLWKIDTVLSSFQFKSLLL